MSTSGGVFMWNSSECGFDFQGLHGCGYMRFRNSVDISN